MSNFRFIDLAGKRFGRLLVLKRKGTASHRGPVPRGSQVTWKCLCDCGETIVTRGTSLRSGHVRSCGCLQIETATKHGHAPSADGRTVVSREYSSYRAMLTRCTNPNHVHFKHYGGRGITVCRRWRGMHGFENFIADMRLRPLGTTLDRIKNALGYSKRNCRWASSQQQRLNQRRVAA
jgi:hypothetical protein